MDNEQREQRNLEMVEPYAAGYTLEAIGQRFGVTRERVRQIIGRYGEVTAPEAREARRRARADEVESFLELHRAAIARLAAVGARRAEIEDRFRLLFPDVPAALVREAVSAFDVLFDHGAQDHTFSDTAVEAAVWYALARELDLNVERDLALPEVDLNESQAVADVLLGAGTTPEDVASVLCRIHVARLHAHDNGVGISARRYTLQRELILKEFGRRSDKGAAVWPPTSQTVMKRLGAGSWADAQVAIGLTPDPRGRPRGLLAFTEDGYREALRQFLDSAAAAGQRAPFEAYNRWVENEERAGRRRPSGTSVRLLSFMLSTPGVWQPGYGFPFLSGAGQFLVKDLLLLGAAIWTVGDSLTAASRRRGAQ